MEKKIGKIKSVKFGYGGYQDCMLGITFDLGNDSWGVYDFKGEWDFELIKRTESTKWTEEDREKKLIKTLKFISKILKEAKVSDVSQLKNIPIEITFDGTVLKEWRILTEVL